MVSNNDEKYFRRVCIKARLVELSLLAAIYQFLIPKSKDCKTLSPTINITIYIMKTIQKRITTKKCRDVSSSVSMLIQKTRYYVMKQECQLLSFRFRETSGSQNNSLSWRSRAIQVRIYQSCCYLFIVLMNLIIEYFMISAH